jgi:hypothetical protein
MELSVNQVIWNNDFIRSRYLRNYPRRNRKDSGNRGRTSKYELKSQQSKDMIA